MRKAADQCVSFTSMFISLSFPFYSLYKINGKNALIRGLKTKQTNTYTKKHILSIGFIFLYCGFGFPDGTLTDTVLGIMSSFRK